MTPYVISIPLFVAILSELNVQSRCWPRQHRWDWSKATRSFQKVRKAMTSHMGWVGQPWCKRIFDVVMCTFRKMFNLFWVLDRSQTTSQWFRTLSKSEIFHSPTSSEGSKWAQSGEQTSEHSKWREQSKQCGRSKLESSVSERVSGASEPASGRASGPVLISRGS